MNSALNKLLANIAVPIVTKVLMSWITPENLYNFKMFIFNAVNKCTDKIPGEWDDNIVDPILYKLLFESGSFMEHWFSKLLELINNLAESIDNEALKNSVKALAEQAKKICDDKISESVELAKLSQVADESVTTGEAQE